MLERKLYDLAYNIDSISFSALHLESGKTQLGLADLNNDGHLEIITIGDHGSPFVNTNQHGIFVFFGVFYRQNNLFN